MNIRTLLTLAAFTAALPFAFALEGHETAAPTAKSDNYPLTTCVVSGDKLGEDGPPVKYTYKQAGKPDRVIEFCCKDCIKDFEKDPAKYLAELDAATAHPGAMAMKTSMAMPTSSAPAKDGSMANCCSSGGKGTCCEVVKAYLPVAAALATDDLAKAQSAAATLAKQADADGLKTISQHALALVHAVDLTAARQAFKSLSSEVTPLVENNKDYTVMHCPMANADWVQTDTTVHNPYYGKAMPSCGMPKEKS